MFSGGRFFARCLKFLLNIGWKIEGRVIPDREIPHGTRNVSQFILRSLATDGSSLGKTVILVGR
jgi:hypothetical protein